MSSVEVSMDRFFLSHVKVSHNLLSVFPFFCFFLFDNYLPEYRIRFLDFIGLAVLLSFSFIRMLGDSRQWFSLSYGSAMFVAGCVLYGIVSLAFGPEQYRPILAILLGAFIYAYYNSLRYINQIYRKWLTAILMFSVAVFFFQGLYYLISGVVPKMVLVAPGDVRVWYGGQFLRLTGLYMEPNNYCIATVMLVLLRRELMDKSFDFLSYIAIATLVMSLSLWGSVIAVVIVAYHYVSTKRNWTQSFYSFVIVSFLVASSILAPRYLLDEDNALRITLIDRAGKILEVISGDYDHVEGSFRDRYLSIAQFGEQNPSDFQMLFGHGINIDDFQEAGGANGLSFLLYSFGLVGLMAIISALVILALKNGLDSSLWIMLTLSSYPLLTYFYWWAWLALLLLFSNRSTWSSCHDRVKP